MKTIPYGKSSLTLPVKLFSPACNCDIFDLPKDTITKINDSAKETELVDNALNNPTDRASIKNWILKDDKVVILVPDITRKCPTSLLLNRLFLNIPSKPSEDVKIIIATGNHRNVTKSEIKSIVGKDIYDKYQVINHDSDGECSYIGTTSRNNDVYINKLAVQADKVIMIGTANFHTFAGYSGSRKSILPGISARSTILYNHKLMLDESELNEKTTIGVFNDNPINNDMFEAIKLFGLEKLFLLNVVTNVFGEILGAYTGCPIKAFDDAVAQVNKSYSQTYNKNYDVIICSAGGHPSDTNFYQSGKTIELFYNLVKNNGHLIIAASCEDGIGENHELYRKFCMLRGKEIIDRLKSHYHNLGTTPYKIDSLIKRGCSTYLVSDYDPEMAQMLRLISVKSVRFQETVQKVLKSYNDKGITPDVAVIPYGCLTALRHS